MLLFNYCSCLHRLHNAPGSVLLYVRSRDPNLILKLQASIFLCFTSITTVIVRWALSCYTTDILLSLCRVCWEGVRWYDITDKRLTSGHSFIWCLSKVMLNCTCNSVCLALLFWSNLCSLLRCFYTAFACQVVWHLYPLICWNVRLCWWCSFLCSEW